MNSSIDKTFVSIQIYCSTVYIVITILTIVCRLIQDTNVTRKEKTQTTLELYIFLINFLLSSQRQSRFEIFYFFHFLFTRLHTYTNKYCHNSIFIYNRAKHYGGQVNRVKPLYYLFFFRFWKNLQNIKSRAIVP